MKNNNSELVKATKESFWGLLNQYTISIPSIQRDYAQGRESAESIRKSFLQDIFDVLDSNEQLDINFVYGNISEKNGKKIFIPIDGQQRLTTLFLMHWYFASWSGNLDEDNKRILKKFIYDTRYTTRDFCERLVCDVQIDVKALDDPEDENDLTEAIKDYYWFFSTYENDPSIKSMLVMLQTIHNMVKEMEDPRIVDGYFEKLAKDSNDSSIYFWFLNLRDAGLTDDIYINMNARGKALTKFENFKAQLTKYLKEKDLDFAIEFIKNVNIEWSEFFWNEEYRPFEDKKNNKRLDIFDDQIMNLFRFIMMNEYILNVDFKELNNDKYIRTVLNDLEKESDTDFVNHLFIDEFRKTKKHETKEANVNEEAFVFINRLLNVLSKRKKEKGKIHFTDNELYQKEYIDEEKLFKKLIFSEESLDLSYEEGVRLYAEFCFLVKYSNEDYSFNKEEQLTEWMRFIYNVAQNKNYNNYSDYFSSIRGLKTIIDDGDAEKILDYLSNLKRENYKRTTHYGFTEDQVEEEVIKANLILKQNKDLIVKAENTFLDGQIAAILDFSGIWSVFEDEIKDLKENDSICENVFKHIATELDLLEEYSRKIELIFNQQDVRPELDENSLLRRALLTFGGEDSYMLPEGKVIRCFLDANDRDRGFKRLFRHDTVCKKYFKELLDYISIEKDVVEQLNTVVENMEYDKENRWKKYFIEMPEILNSVRNNKDGRDPEGEYVFRDSKRFIFKRSSDEILLLTLTRTNCIHREYYSYALFIKACQQNIPVHYCANSTEDAPKYLYYLDKNKKEIQIVYEEDSDGEYKYIVKDGENSPFAHKDVDEMLEYIKRNAVN